VFLDILWAISNVRFVVPGLYLVHVKANIQPGHNGSIRKVRVKKHHSFKEVAGFC
jgi:hypothetical protein